MDLVQGTTRDGSEGYAVESSPNKEEDDHKTAEEIE